MRRTAALLLALCLLVTGSALAELAPVVRSGALAAYSDGQGKLYIPGRDDAVNSEAAGEIISIDNYRLAYLAVDEDGSSDLRLIDLESLEDTLAVENVYTACLLDESLYFVPDGSREELKALDLADMTVSDVHTANEAIDRLYASAEGMAFGLVDQAGAYLYDPDTDTVEPYAGELPRAGLLMDGYEVYTDEAGGLYLKDAQEYDVVAVAADVTAFTALDGVVYYLMDDGSAQRLMSYDPGLRLSGELSGDLEGMEDQLTASDGRLYTINIDGDIYAFDPGAAGNGELVASYGDLSGYDLPENTSVSGLRIEGMPGYLNVYAVLEDEEALPDFTFIEFEEEAEAAEAQLFLLDAVTFEDEATVWDAMMPAEQYTTLARGSRGEAVRAIQQPLYDLGYYDYYVDGIFGPRTQWAIRLLQADLNQPDNGIADAALQRTILSGTLSPHDPYIPLPRGSRGLRVQIMQQRLRDLGYLADAADRIYGGRTQKAVQLFQKENGIGVSDRATRETLRRLYSDLATPCSSFIDLYPGDTGYRVRALNNRLRDLFYLESSIGSVYTAQTVSAVRVFQRTAGMPETGEATVAVQQRLFADDAPEAPGFILLRRGDSNARVARLQRRLRELGYFHGSITGYFGRQTQDAVALFQQKVGLRVTGVATVRTQQLLFANGAPVYVKPTHIGKPVISIDNYEYEDGGVYYISDDSSPRGYVVFDWYAEGDVSGYSVDIVDSKGNTCLSQDTLLTRTGVSVATLKYNRVYTLTVTAHPEDNDPAHVTSARLRFARIKPAPVTPEIGKIGNPALSVKTVARVENGVNYVMPGKLTLRWHADGAVDHYRVSVADESDGVLLEIGSTTDESTSLNTDQLTQGEIYTLSVYAIPTNGTMEHARMRSLRFALPEVELPEPEPTPEPTPEPRKPDAPVPLSITRIDFETVDHEENGISYLTGDTITLSWSAEGSVGKYIIQLTDGDGNVVTSGNTVDTSLTFSRSKLKPDVVYTLTVTAVPEGGALEDGVSATGQFALFTPAEEGDEADAGEEAEPEAPDGEQPGDETSEEAESVEAEPVTSEEPEASEGEPEPAEEPDVAEGETEPSDGPEAEPDAPEADAIGIPELVFSPSVNTDGDVTYVSGDVITLSWETEGDVQAFDVKIMDGSGAQRASTTTDLTSLNVRSTNLAPGEIYTLTVTAMPADTSAESTDASARFALYTEAEEPDAGSDAAPEDDAAETAEPEPEQPEDEPAEAVEEPAEAEEEYSEAEEAEPSVPDQAEEETADAGEGDEAEPVADDGPAYAVLPEPVIGLDPVADVVDGISYVSEGTVQLSWQVDGAVQSYDVSITDGNGNVMATTNTEKQTLKIGTGGMVPGEVYTLSVTAIPAEANTSGSTGSARFGLYAAAEAPEPEPEPEETYEEPEETYEEPEESYEEPEETYEEPEQTYEEPEETYEEPEETYEEPEESYEEPEESYEESETYEEPEPEAPSYEPVSAPSIDFGPVADAYDGTTFVQGENITMYWGSEGDVQTYDIQITDSNGDVVASASTGDTSITLSASNMVPGEVYTLKVTARPMDPDSDSASSSARFALYAEAAPEASDDGYPEEDYDYGDESYDEDMDYTDEDY